MRKETIEEFLARGGKIQKIDPQPIPDSTTIVKSTAKTPVKLQSLAEGAHFFAEKTKRTQPKKELDLTGIDMELLPDGLAEIFQKEGKDEGE